jgi:NAD+ synthase
MRRFLFVIDMQNDFVDGSLGSKEAREILPAVAAKIRAFEGERIVATLDTHFADTYGGTLEGQKLPVPHCFEGTDGHRINAVVRAALEEKGYVAVKKYTFGALDAVNELKNELADTRPEEIEFEVIGLCTDICVVSNALLLRAAFPNSIIKVDAACCAGVTPELHDAALATMRSCQIDVVNEAAPKRGYTFDAAAQRDAIVEWIRNWFADNGPASPAAIGISGGKDSTVVAALCARALGPERVIGVMMPDGVQPDIDDSQSVIKALGIRGYTVNIHAATSGVLNSLGKAPETQERPVTISAQTRSNLPPRIRMSTLYALSQSMNGRVAHTCNLSETMIGWETKWGDAVGDFSPLAGLTASEVVAIGLTMPEIPVQLVVKAPSDGLCGRTDEDAFGFRYAELDNYLRTGSAESEVKAKIDAKIRASAFKRKPIAGYDPGLWRIEG